MVFDSTSSVAKESGSSLNDEPPDAGALKQSNSQGLDAKDSSYVKKSPLKVPINSSFEVKQSNGSHAPPTPLPPVKEFDSMILSEYDELPTEGSKELSPRTSLDYPSANQPLDLANEGFEGDDELDVIEEQKMKKKTMFNSKSELKKKAVGKFTASPLFNSNIFRSSKTAGPHPNESSDSEVDGVEPYNGTSDGGGENSNMYPKFSSHLLKKRSKSDVGLDGVDEPEKERDFFMSLSRRRFRKSRTKSDFVMSDSNGNENGNMEDIGAHHFIHSDTEIANITDTSLPPKKKSLLRNFGQNTDLTPGHARRHTLFNLDHSPSIDWKDLKNSLKFNILGSAKKKKEETTDKSYLKSAELISEVAAGAPAAIIVATMFQRDDRNTQRIPILLEQLKLTLTDTSTNMKEKNRNYQMDLEYGSGPARLRWSVRKEFKDFWSFHSKFKVLKLQGNSVGSKLVLPSFPARHSIFQKVERKYKESKKSTTGEAGVPISPLEPGHRMNSSASAPSANSDGLTRQVSAISEVGSRSPSVFSDSSRSFSGLSSRASNYFKNRKDRFTRSVGTFWDTSNVNDALVHEYVEALRVALEMYILEMFKVLRFRADANRLFQFLEVSNMTIRLAPESSFHGKEGYLILRSSAAVQGWRVSHWRPNDISQMVVRHTSKWYMVRESYIICVKDISGTNILEVFLVDPGFRVTYSDSTKDEDDQNSSQVHITFQLENLERKMKLVTHSRRQLGLWMDSINQMREQSVWSKPHRFNSFAPVRNNVQAQWFVDGVSVPLFFYQFVF